MAEAKRTIALPAFGEWRPIATAPRDGTRILVVVRPSEQWEAEVELARWAKPRHAAEPCWMAADTGPNSSTIFGEGELSHWMPLPEPPAEDG